MFKLIFQKASVAERASNDSHMIVHSISASRQLNLATGTAAEMISIRNGITGTNYGIKNSFGSSFVTFPQFCLAPFFFHFPAASSGSIDE
jgi:hypothetical protein